MNVTQENPLLAVDVYKLGHMEQYAPGTTKVYSHLVARSNKTFDKTVFFGLQYFLKEYLSTPLTREMGDELLAYHNRILPPASKDVVNKIYALCDLGYFPIRIKAVKEGTVMPVRNVLMTIESTHDDFHWVVGFIESMILKLWYPITVASCSYKYHRLVDQYYRETASESIMPMRDFTVHDFGYRGDSSEEGAALSGAAHLLSFFGSDTVPALPFIDRYYSPTDKGGNMIPEWWVGQKPIMLSVPASEHSVMCSFGRENELDAFYHMLRTYPTGIVSIVSDTYNIYDVLTRFMDELKDDILARDGKVVIRPDSGDPETIICGDPSAPGGSPEQLGAIRLLDRTFGSTVNEKGYRELNPKIGLIYGDGMYYERYERTLRRLKEMGYAASNLVIGVGGILRNHSRDTLGFAMKATYVEVNGEHREIEKDPITDQKKKSLRGLLRLEIDNDGQFITYDRQTEEEANSGLLQTVYEDGQVLRNTDILQIRDLVSRSATLHEVKAMYLESLK